MRNKFDYVLSVFRKIYAIPDEVQINYGLNMESRIQIKTGKISYFQDYRPLDLSETIWKMWRDEKVPFFFDSYEEAVISQERNCVIINFDIIANSFFFLSGWQEYVCDRKDSYGRFPFSESVQYKLDFVEKPVVNYYFDILKKAIEVAYDIQLERKLWPEHDFAVCLTHDIDKCKSAWLEDGIACLRQGQLNSAAKLVLKKIFAQDEWFNVDEILDLERQNGVNSSFYFLCKQGKVEQVENADYDISSPKLQTVLKSIRDAGSEVALHGSYKTHDDFDVFHTDYCSINGEQPLGNRFHFLAFDIRVTPAILEKAGVLYDSTLGFTQHIGFRNAFCHPFYLYDISQDKALKVLEIPLSIMDTSLQALSYMNIEPENVNTCVRKMIDEVQRFNGCLTILWHNTHFSHFSYRKWRDAYLDLLKLCRRENAKFITAAKAAGCFSK